MFSVAAGKFDGQERTTSHIGCFSTFEQALAAWDLLKDYPWAEIGYTQPFSSHVFIITPYERID